MGLIDALHGVIKLDGRGHRLRGLGLALLIAEQNISFLEVATRVFVLEGGRIRFSGTVAEMSNNEALHRAYFGLK